VVTVTGVSVGVAFAATTGPVPGVPGGQGVSHQTGDFASGSASRQALSGRADRYRPTATRAATSPSERPRPAVTGRGDAGSGRRPAATHRPGTHRPAAKHVAAAAAGPYEFYDAVDPQTVPPGYEVATYADGPHPTPVSEVAGRKQVLWIDVDGSDPQAQVLDVEPGCATPAQVPQWVQSRVTDQPGAVAIVYTMISEWPAVQSAVASLPEQVQSQIRWWIADPTGSPHVVPGSSATQWYWGSNYDISTALPGF
jgi:hypothetical protein